MSFHPLAAEKLLVLPKYKNGFGFSPQGVVEVLPFLAGCPNKLITIYWTLKHQELKT